MKDATVQTAATSSANQGNDSGMMGTALRLLWIIPAVAFLILVLFLSIGRTKLSESGIKFVIILVYSALIVPFSAVTCSWIGHRYSDGYPRLVMLFYALALVCTATAGTLAADLVLQWLGIVPRGGYWEEFRNSWFFSIVITLVIGSSISAFEDLRYKFQAATLEARTRQMEHERANKLFAEARLSALESSIHPHFLFNTLNSIAALIPSDPQRAEDTVGKLASLLRFSLNAQHSSLVLLDQELKVVRDFLEIEKTRFGQRLRYEILAPGSLGSVKVPPLSLQTLAENSVKHVAAQRVEGASIEVRGRMEAGRIILEVIDDGPGFSLGAVTPEHGLGNLVARLELLFGDKGQLDVLREQERTIARISFPAES
jgi:sensor histidine kinase YesM